MRDAANLYRRVVFLAVVLLCMAPVEGETAHAVGALAVLGSLALYLVQGLRTLRLNLAWHAGYLLIIVNEGLRNAELISAAVDRAAYDTASRYITAANAAVLLVRSCWYDEREPEPEYVRPARANDAGRLGIFLGCLYLFFLFNQIPQVLSFSQVGRAANNVEVGRSALETIREGISTSAGVILPAALLFYARFVRGWAGITGMLLAIPIFGGLYLTGIRFLLLMAAAGAFALYVPVHRTQKLPFGRFAVLGLILYTFASTMSVFRTHGFSQTDLSSFEEYYAGSTLGMHSEGVIDTLAKMVDYFRNRDFLLGRSSITILVFWIPRQLWPGKPTFIDYWFIREYQGEQGFNQGFSTGSTFASDAYVDFGFYGGVLFCGLVFGSLLAWLDRAAVRLLVRQGSPFVVVVAPLFGGALFAVRSFNTTVIQMSGVLFMGTVFALLCERSTRPALGAAGGQRGAAGGGSASRSAASAASEATIPA